VQRKCTCKSREGLVVSIFEKTCFVGVPGHNLRKLKITGPDHVVLGGLFFVQVTYEHLHATLSMSTPEPSCLLVLCPGMQFACALEGQHSVTCMYQQTSNRCTECQQALTTSQSLACTATDVWTQLALPKHYTLVAHNMSSNYGSFMGAETPDFTANHGVQFADCCSTATA
jgi:hypothetical protein